MITAILLAIWALFFYPKLAFAQDVASLSPVAVNVRINDPDAKVGDVISITGDGLKRSTLSADVGMYGVVVDSPIISAFAKSENTRSVVTSGVANVNISTSAGNIEVGDLLTSSQNPGVAQRAKVGGYVLGRALAKYDDSSKTGQIPVEVNISFSQLTAGLDAGSIGRILTDPNNLRLVLAVIVAIITFIATSYTTIRLLASGVTAIGRNPLAKRTIVGGMVISSLFVGLIALGGLGIALAIINLGR